MKNTRLLLYSAAQTRELDRLAIEKEGVSGFELMTRAAVATFQYIRRKTPFCRQIIVLCGLGNNGGDGYLIAQMAHDIGLRVTVYQLGDLQKQKGDALKARNQMQTNGVSAMPYTADVRMKADVIVDAMLGTGLVREVDGLWLSAIQAVNSSSAYTVAVDIPSGLHADTGCQMGCAVKADTTVTFIAHKQGMYTGDGMACSGQICFESLGISPNLYAQLPSQTFLLPKSFNRSLLSARKVNSHKGLHGHVLIVGGAPSMNGAVTMAACAALRSGCGLVSVATHPSHATSINLYQPEIMSHGVESINQLNELIEAADVIVFGPGLGQSDWSQTLFDCIMETNIPLVLDADGLNLLAKQALKQPTQKRNHWVLTPHPGEAGRLLNCSTSQVQEHRFQAVQKLQQAYGGISVLKGAGTLIADDRVVQVCPLGNPGMASAGMGDVLSGVLGGVIAQTVNQSIDITELVSFAVCLHSAAGDAAAQAGGERGLLATDLLPHIRSLVND